MDICEMQVVAQPGGETITGAIRETSKTHMVMETMLAARSTMVIK
jgi:hypothetical protein